MTNMLQKIAFFVLFVFVADVSAWSDDYCVTVNFTARFNINKFDGYPKTTYDLPVNKSKVLGGECGNDLSKISVKWIDATHVGHMNITFTHVRKGAFKYYKLNEIAFKFPVAMLGINENKMLDMYYHYTPFVMWSIDVGTAFNNKSLSFTLPLSNVHGNVSLGTLKLTKVYIKAQSVCEFQTFCELDMTSSYVMLIVTGSAAILAIFSTLVYYHKAILSAIW